MAMWDNELFFYQEGSSAFWSGYGQVVILVCMVFVRNVIRLRYLGYYRAGRSPPAVDRRPSFSV